MKIYAPISFAFSPLVFASTQMIGKRRKIINFKVKSVSIFFFLLLHSAFEYFSISSRSLSREKRKIKGGGKSVKEEIVVIMRVILIQRLKCFTLSDLVLSKRVFCVTTMLIRQLRPKYRSGWVKWNNILIPKPFSIFWSRKVFEIWNNPRRD